MPGFAERLYTIGAESMPFQGLRSMALVFCKSCWHRSWAKGTGEEDENNKSFLRKGQILFDAFYREGYRGIEALAGRSTGSELTPISTSQYLRSRIQGLLPVGGGWNHTVDHF